MDIIFNFFLWCKVAEVKKKIEKTECFLKLIGTDTSGVSKDRTSTNCPICALKGYLNETGRVHMPPFAITTSRIYDMVAVFGLIRWDRASQSILDPAVSDRLTTHLKVCNSSALAFIICLFQLESATKGGSSGILQSEHMFHKLLTCKRSCYENATRRQGDVFGIEPVM